MWDFLFYKNGILKYLEKQNEKLLSQTKEQKYLYEKLNNRMEITMKNHCLYKKRTVKYIYTVYSFNFFLKIAHNNGNFVVQHFYPLNQN